MSSALLERCLGLYAAESSVNHASEAFQRALALHLRGCQSESVALLTQLTADHEREGRAQEVFEARHLTILALVALGDLDRAEREAARFLGSADHDRYPRWHGRALGAVAAVNHQQGHSAYALDLARRAKSILAVHGNAADVARACYVLGACLVLQSDLGGARTELQSAVSLARVAGEPLVLAMANRRLAFCLQKLGRYEDADHAYHEALSTYIELGADRRVAQTQYSLAVLCVRRGDLDAARRLLDEARRGYSPETSAVGYARWLQASGWISLLEGEPARAIADLAKARAQFVSAQAQRDAALCDEFLGDAHALSGKTDRALQSYEEGISSGRRVSEFADIVVECIRKKGDLLVRGGDVAGALEAARAAKRLTTRYQDRLEIAAIRRLRGLIKLARGCKGRAFELLQSAWAELEHMGARMEARVTAQLIATLLEDERRAHEAAVWRNLGGAGRLPALGFFLPRASGAPPVVVPESRGLDSLAAQAAEHGIVTRDPRVLKAFELTVRGAPSRLPLLIFGETGTGKELLAAVAHGFSGRGGAFVPINCAALPPDLLDAELFGHARGAYTGAMRDRAGLIEAASDGTLFLDEIGEMSLPVQGRLLRAIEIGEVRRLGENRPRHVNTRFVGATHRDLQEMVRQGGFRADLFFRLRGIVVALPPLRERPWDVDLLVDHFLAREGGRAGGDLRLAQPARERLRGHAWPGNVRELRSLVERLAAMHAGGGLVDAEDLGLDTVRVAGSLEEHLEDEERRRLIATLESVQWNRTRAANILNLKRTTLLGKMRRLGIVPPSKK